MLFTYTTLFRSSASFTVNATPATGVSSSVVWAVMLEMVGGSFTGLTVNRKLVLAVPPSASLTDIEIMGVQYSLGRGAKATVWLVTSPVKMIFLSVISAELD